MTASQPLMQMTLAALSAGTIVLMSYRLRLLSLSGAVAAFLLGTVLFGLGGWPWAIPILAFFLSSSFLSKLGNARKNQADQLYAKSSRRDGWQVMANGGVAGVAVLFSTFFGSELPFVFFLGSVAAVNGDTWSTEIGPMTQSRPRLITRAIRVDAGTSGAISMGGTLAAGLGGLWIAVAAIWVHPFHGISTWYICASLALSGLFGSLIDSLLGATLQAQFRCPACEATSEKKQHCPGTTAEQVRGLRTMQNDTVNVLAALAGGCAALVLFHLGSLTNG